MKVIDTGISDKVKRLALKPKYFSRCESRMLEKSRPKRSSKRGLLEILQDEYACDERSSVIVKASDSKIANKMTVGLFTIDHAKTMRVMRRLAYYATCECGSVGYFTADELISRHNAEFGCLLPGCTLAPIAVRLWYHPRTALALQIAQADTLFPERLSKGWREALSPWEAGQAAFEGLGSKLDLLNGGWWFEAVKLRGLLFPEEVVITDKPDSDLFPKGNVHLKLEGEIMTVSDAALSFGREEEEILTMKLNYWDHGAIERLLEGK